MAFLGWNMKTWGLAMAVALGAVAAVNRTPLRGYIKRQA